MLRLCVSFIAFTTIANPLGAVSPDPRALAVPSADLAKSRSLVRQLGSEDFEEREEAEKELGKMGRLARLALLEGLNADPNPEVRTRCASLLPKANALEMRARLDAFLADVEGKYDHDLPGWNQFHSVVCKEISLFGCPVMLDPSLEKAARSTFVELISTPINKSVAMAVGSSRQQLGAVVVERRQELYSQKYGRPIGAAAAVAANAIRKNPTSEDIATLLFAETYAPQTTARVPRQASIAILINSSDFTSQALESDEKGRVYKAIAAAWLETRVHPLDLQHGISLASTLGLNEQSLKMAARLFATPTGTPNNRGNAALTIAARGTKEHIPLLEKSFEDTAVLTLARFGGAAGAGPEANREIQVRDLALAVSIQLSGQSVEDYGFHDEEKGNRSSYLYARYYLPADKREAAFEKWKAWRAKNP